MYKIVASLDKNKASVGGWDITIADDQNALRSQEVVTELLDVYPEGVWYQDMQLDKPTEEEVLQRIADLEQEE